LLELLIESDLWKYASIPFVAALVGWSTNLVAIKLIFRPLEFVGIRPFLGWQGIIPSKAVKMSHTFVDSTMARLGRFPELIEQLEPETVAAHVNRYLDSRIETLTDEVVRENHAVLWENMPRTIRNQIVARVRQRLPDLVDAVLGDVNRNIDDLIDLKDFVTSTMVRDKSLLNRLFEEPGAAEFRFIIRSGAYFGFVFGLAQLVAWYFYPAWWVLPLAGLLVGFLTNWIAINLIFRPLNPRKIGRWTVQGLFLKRQKEVAAVWCSIVTREILTIRQIAEAILTGPKADAANALIKLHIKPIVDDVVGPARTIAQLAVGIEGFAQIKESVGQVAVGISPRPFDDPIFNEERAEVAEAFLRQRMESLPTEQFQDLLRPCFQEDEWKLIAMGAVLGLLAGFGQLVLVFGWVL